MYNYIKKEGDKPRVKQGLIIWIIIGITYLIVWLLPFIGPDSWFSGEKPEATIVAEAALRVLPEMKWYIVPIFVIVLYLYFDQIEKKKWAAVYAGLGLWLWDWFNEIWNSFFYIASGRYGAPWVTAGESEFVILIGLNVEITLMFLVMGLMSTKILPEDKEKKIGPLNNRHFYAIVMSIVCVVVEIILNLIGGLPWVYPWWNWYFPFIVILIGYLPFWEIAYYIHDLPDNNERKKFVAAVALLIIVLMIIGFSAGWL